MLIVLDAGHGGKDPGANANGLLEKDITLELALKVGSYLKANYNCDVNYTRDKDVFLTLSERANTQIELRQTCFVHFILIVLDLLLKVLKRIVIQEQKGKTLEFQKDVHEEVMKVLKPYNIADRGMKQKDFAVVRKTSMPALLTETLFISNPNEAKLLKSEAFLT